MKHTAKTAEHLASTIQRYAFALNVRKKHMAQATRQPKYDKFWVWVEPSINGYSAALDMLLRMLTDDQLDQFLAEIADGLPEPSDTP